MISMDDGETEAWDWKYRCLSCGTIMLLLVPKSFDKVTVPSCPACDGNDWQEIEWIKQDYNSGSPSSI